MLAAACHPAFVACESVLIRDRDDLLEKLLADCHTAAMRRWREEHRRELAVRRRDAAAARDDDARAQDSGRAKLVMALRRGTLERGRCREEWVPVRSSG